MRKSEIRQVDANPPVSQLVEFLESQSTKLLPTLRLYVLRSGLANGAGGNVEELTRELLSEVVLEVLLHADRFDEERSPLAWTLGIAANLLKRKQAARAKLWQREASLSDLYPALQNELSEDELFDRVARLHTPGLEAEFQANEEAHRILGLVAEEDQKILRLAILTGLNGSELAQALGTNPGTARVRLHRALGRLQTAWQQQQAQEKIQ